MDREKVINEALDMIKKTFPNIREFKVKLVKGIDSSYQPPNYFHLGEDAVKLMGDDELKALIIHESLHGIFIELDETEEFRIKDETGDWRPYIKKELETWKFVARLFPELKKGVEKGIIRQLPQ